ncbi:hypothetical protein SH580_21935 [Coraliomargarita algicola]|uniref:Outer membrane lipoprotein BamD-like domain-containing protein n=1 Tax=Coraliomargarita algicola TaxID=3092156 RepID=A0ABZ0RMU1_9BACT|nr:hypothetical protein [Coraliomargarita sp. J2-16]WPJ96080.1 hypothetical protein SH580_21935 [Coraliomargarita sp. J2-16]
MSIQPSPKYQSPQRLIRSICISIIVLLTACQGDKELSQSELEALIEDGITSLQTYSFDLAYTALSQAHSQLNESNPDYTKITYCFALATWHKNPPSSEALLEAEQLLQSVIEKSPNSQWAASALIDLGRIHEVADFNSDLPDVAAAQDYYKQVISQFPHTDHSAKATLHLAQTMIQDFDPASTEAAADLLKEAIQNHPDSHWLSTIAQFTAQVYAFYLNDKEEALNYYAIAWEHGFPRKSEADLALWQYALLAQECDQELLAAKLFTEIVQEHPRSLYGTLARERVINIAAKHPDADLVIPTLRSVKVY